MRTKLSTSLMLVLMPCSIRCRVVDSLPDADDHRALFNDKWPAKQIPVRRYHEWGYSGAATGVQYNKGTTRGVGPKDPQAEDDDHYFYEDDVLEEEYYYGPTNKHDKRPSEQDFEYYEKIPKHDKGDGKGKGTAGKSSKHDHCKNYHFEQEHEYEIHPENGQNENEPDDEYGHFYGKGTRGGKGKGEKTKKSTKSSKKTKVCTDPPCKYNDRPCILILSSLSSVDFLLTICLNAVIQLKLRRPPLRILLPTTFHVSLGCLVLPQRKCMLLLTLHFRF
jgi:hypothetical protein